MKDCKYGIIIVVLIKADTIARWEFTHSVMYLFLDATAKCTLRVHRQLAREKRKEKKEEEHKVSNLANSKGAN